MRSLSFLLVLASIGMSAEPDDTTKALRDYAAKELDSDPGKTGKFTSDFSRQISQRIADANKADREAWTALNTKSDWEAFRNQRLANLRQSLGTFPEVPKQLKKRVTKTIEGDGYRIDNCLFESRPGLWVAGNLYKPAKPGASCPGILLCHSHHNPKHEGELQDMGVLWAKLGCYVLVIDQLGHGERRVHPFNDAKSYPEMFRVGRQDYFFRYNLGMQLALLGESLTGWMAWDMMRGVDLLLAQPGIAKDKIALLGAVAGGGDPAAVTAALDPRIDCVCPFNFGGPQPETKYPLPDNADEWFNYAGGGSWESTRNLRDSVAGGFLPWTIVASVAPRKIIHAHEFSWDQERDPVWKRYQKIYGWYDAKENLAFAHGRGVIVGNDPMASHCNNIGVIHRQLIYAAFKKWYGIPIPEKEIRDRRSADELRCWTPEALKELQPKPLTTLLEEHATKQQQANATKPLPDRWQALWPTNSKQPPKGATSLPVGPVGTVVLQEYRLPVEGRAVAITVVQPAKKDTRFPFVVAVCQEGQARFLHEHAATITHLLHADIAFAIIEVRGTGRDRTSDGRGRSSGATSASSSTQMLGTTLLAQRANDFQVALRWLRAHPAYDARVALWGESFAAPNAAEAVVAVPHDASPTPKLAEPMAATLVGVAALSNTDVKAVLARGGLTSYRSVLASPFVHVPHDALPVRLFAASDLPELWQTLDTKKVRLEGMVDARNQRIPVSKASGYQPSATIELHDNYSDLKTIAAWFAASLRK